MVIGGYYINGYWWIFNCRYWGLLMIIILMVIGEYFIGGYRWLFHCKPLVVILLVVVDGYFINDY